MAAPRPQATQHSVPLAGMAGSEAPPIVHGVLASPGERIAPDLRARFEPCLGIDRSGVRIHRDGAAAASADAVDALAYGVGHDVVFGAGRFDPRSERGQRLIAHELVHVSRQEKAP